MTIIAVIGIFTTQFFWYRNDIKIKEKQFNHRVCIAQKKVTSDLGQYYRKIEQNDSSENGNSNFDFLVIDKLIQIKLDSLLKKELVNYNITTPFVYGIIEKKTGQFLYKSTNNLDEELINTPYKTGLSFAINGKASELSVFFPDKHEFLMSEMIIWIILLTIFLLVILLLFTITLVLLYRQKRYSEMKTDFLNNMTHEFKTPIATISLASEMLIKPSVQQSPEKTERYTKIIFDENARLKNQVDQVLQISILNKREVKLKKRDLNAHDLIENCTRNASIHAKQRGGTILSNLQANKFNIYADRIHFSNIISNLLDNAIKYCLDAPRIIVSTKNVEDYIRIAVEDNGFGISQENQKHVFRRFFRVPTGNVHNVKGFGLGLYYVKSMVETHDGHVEIKSELNKGTRVEIFFPIYY